MTITSTTVLSTITMEVMPSIISLSINMTAIVTSTMMEELVDLATTCVRTHMLCTIMLLCEQPER